jgi:hypothetical protein
VHTSNTKIPDHSPAAQRNRAAWHKSGCTLPLPTAVPHFLPSMRRCIPALLRGTWSARYSDTRAVGGIGRRSAPSHQVRRMKASRQHGCRRHWRLQRHRTRRRGDVCPSRGRPGGGRTRVRGARRPSAGGSDGRGRLHRHAGAGEPGRWVISTASTVWVNAAAVSLFGPFREVPLEDFRRVLQVNVMGLRARRPGGPAVSARPGTGNAVVSAAPQPDTTAYVIARRPFRR